MGAAELASHRVAPTQSVAFGFGLNAAIEVPVLQAGVYTYYGNQPFQVAGFPLWWMFVNTGGALTAGFFIWRVLLPAVRRPQLLAAVPLVTGPAYISWSVIVGLPLHTTLNTGVSLAATTAAGTLTVGLCVLAYHMITQVACADGSWRQPARAGATTAPSPSTAQAAVSR